MDTQIKTVTSKNNPDDSLGIIFNEQKLSDVNNIAYITPTSKVSSSDPLKNLSTHTPIKSFETSFLDGGTIITDRRKKRATIKDYLDSAFDEWWGSTKQKFKKPIEVIEQSITGAPQNDPVIEKTEDRTEVIKGASVYTAQAPKDDYLSMTERVTAARAENISNVIRPTISIKNISAAPKPYTSWLHRSDKSRMIMPVSRVNTGARDLVESTASLPETSEAPTPNNSVVKNPLEPARKVFSDTPIVSQSKSLKQMEPAIIENHVTQKVDKHDNPLETTTPTTLFGAKPKPTISFEPQFSQTTPVTTDPTSIPAQVLHSTAAVSDDAQTIESSKDSDLSPISLVQVSQNNIVRIVVKVFIILIIIITGVFLALLASSRITIFENSSSTPVTTPEIISQILRTDSQTAINLSPEAATFLIELSSKIEKAPHGVSQFYPVVMSEADQHTANAREIFKFLDTHISNKTIYALEDSLVFGSVTTSKNEPFIVMQSFNFDVLFSGLLASEQHLQSDFIPIFGVPGTSSNGFKDAIIANKSTRVLKNDTGEVLLLYAFVNQNTVVITTSQAALLIILERF